MNLVVIRSKHHLSSYEITAKEQCVKVRNLMLSFQDYITK